MSLMWPIVRKAIAKRKQIAVVDDQGEWSYGKLLGGALFAANYIAKNTKKKNVGILLPTSGAFPLALLGCWFAKRVGVPFNYLLASDELEYVIKDADIDLLITATPMLDFIGGEDLIPKHIKVVKLDEIKKTFKGIPRLRIPPFFKKDDVAALLYTSGTSGRPKGVMLTHGNFRSNCEACVEHARLTEWDIFGSVLPQFHSFGLTASTLLPLVLGAKVVYTARFVPTKVVEMIRKNKVGIFLAIPSMYGALLSVKSATREDFESMKIVISGGEPLPDSIYQSFKERFNIELLEGFGLTETTPVTNWSTKWANKKGSVGLSLPGVRAYIVDEKNKIVPANTEGELVFNGANVMKGYYKLPKMTAEVMVDIDVPGEAKPVRVFKTGDVARIDEDGFLFITGRMKEMIIISGENVSPREIEEVLNKHKCVKASAVIGKHDDMRGEVPIAYVEAEEGIEFDDADVRKWCRENLAQFKVPREINVIEELPRNPTGKIMRRKLVEAAK